ncbi:MAG: hypothetical protein FJ014_18650 [Chloroflexi bacterium]|nr:hypothetical protein [Chloroflexota bacterium]
MTDSSLTLRTRNRLPSDAAWLFPEYEFESMDPERHAGVIVERVLERGTWAQLHWLFADYGEARVAEWVRRYGFRLLTKRSFALWRLALGVEDYVAPAWAIEAKKVTTQAVIASEAKQSPSCKEEIASSQKTLLAMTRAEQLPKKMETW